ncbi:hypothetical protein RCJ22_35305 [Vibrio sp. FNV 38]|nr:hypothetical protein [Vibrio sp. FNV 38]
MKIVTAITIIATAALSTTVSAYGGGSSGNQGRALGPEIKCEMKNGDIASVPALYCKIFDGKEVQ